MSELSSADALSVEKIARHLEQAEGSILSSDTFEMRARGYIRFLLSTITALTEERNAADEEARRMDDRIRRLTTGEPVATKSQCGRCGERDGKHETWCEIGALLTKIAALTEERDALAKRVEVLEAQAYEIASQDARLSMSVDLQRKEIARLNTELARHKDPTHTEARRGDMNGLTWDEMAKLGGYVSNE